MTEGKGILALVGAAPKEDESDDGDDESPKARAMKDMMAAMKSGNWNAAGHAFQRAYDICKMKSAEPDADDAPDDDEGEEDY